MVKKLLLALALLCSIVMLVPSAQADEKGAGTGVSSPQACDWDYRNHPWSITSRERVFYAQGSNGHFYEAWISHELQTRLDRNGECTRGIRNASDLTCYYRTSPTGPRNLSSCEGYGISRLAIQVGNADYDRVENAEAQFFFHTNSGTTTLYSDWTFWSNDCWLPMTEFDRFDFHGDTWYLPGAANYYPIGCKVPYHNV
jgi:hypothetical protein